MVYICLTAAGATSESVTSLPDILLQKKGMHTHNNYVHLLLYITLCKCMY